MEERKGSQQEGKRKQVGKGKDRGSPKVGYSQRVVPYLHIRTSSTMIRIFGLQSLVEGSVYGLHRLVNLFKFFYLKLPLLHAIKPMWTVHCLSVL